MIPTPATLDALDDKARAATPGPWERVNVAILGRESDGELYPVAQTYELDECPEDAAYIAACSPDVALALTKALREAWAKIEIGERMAQALTPFAAVEDGSPEIPDHTPAMFPCRVGQVRTATRVLAEWKAHP